MEDFVAGSAAGVVVVAIGHPLDVIKVQMQTTRQNAMALFWERVKRPARLYAGATPLFLGAPPMVALQFGGYAIGRRLVTGKNETPKAHELTLSETVVAGGIAGCCIVPVLGPAERLKILLQTQKANVGDKGYRGARNMLAGVYADSGWRGLVRGSVLTAWRDVPGCAIYFGLYEWIKRAQWLGSGDLNTMWAGGMSGMLTWAVTFPIDVVKTLVQRTTTPTPPRTMDIVRHVMATQGIKGFFRGISPVLVRAFPVNAAAFYTLETTLSWLHRPVKP